MRFGVRKDTEDALQAKMDLLKIKSSDIIERFVRSGKKGGQKVNKTSSCVYLKHRPTGIEVKCDKERLQSLNRFFARRILVNKIEVIVLGRKAEVQKTIAKIRSQKRKRSRTGRLKMLRYKVFRSAKKDLRKPPPKE